MTTHEVLARAREILERDGHTQHIYLDDDGRHCAQGAILASLSCLDPFGRPCNLGTQEEGNRPRIRAANIALAANLPPAQVTDHEAARGLDSEWADAVERIVAWNNAGGRTEVEVLAAFDRAIAGLKVPS